MSRSGDADWARLRIAFDELVDCDDDRRATMLDEIGVSDPALRAELDRLLDADASADDRLERIDRVLGDGGRRGADPLGMVGRTLDHFRIDAPLATGGMGVVYRAFDTSLGRAVALKFPLPHQRPDARVTERFRREARAAAALDHPAICSVYEAGETDDGQLFLAMALYEGETLKARLERDGSLPVPEAVDIATQIARGLAAAHRAGVVHRDLKPANIMMLPDGGVKILDFGLARTTDAELTTSRGTLGTIAYMAPELIRGDVGAGGDARADLWALGVLLYEMLAGERPFAHRHEVALMHAILTNQPVRPSMLRTGVESDLDSLVLALLAKDPRARPGSAERVLELLAESAAVPARVTVGPASRQHIRAGAAVAAVVLTLFGFGAWLTRQETAADPAPRVVAVMPFQHEDEDPDAVAVGAALADAIANRLSRLGRVAVPQVLTIVTYPAAGGDVAVIAGELGADGVVKGRIAGSAGSLDIAVEVYDARRKRSRERSFTVARAELHAMLPRLVREVTSGLRLDVTRDERAQLLALPTVSAEAWELFLRGRAVQLQNSIPNANITAESIRQAQSLYAMARELDPDFALARARLALTHLQMAQRHDSTYNRREQVRLEAEAALRLDERLVEAHMALAAYYRMTNDDERSAAQLQRAIAAAPNRSDLRISHAARLRDLGHWDEAVAELETAALLDPRNPNALMQAAPTYARMRRYHDAIRAWDRLIAINPDDVTPKLMRGYSYQRLGIIDSLAATLERIPPDHDEDGMITWSRYVVLRAQRRHAEALVMLDGARHDISRDGLIYRPVTLLRAQTLQEMGETARARPYYATARNLLEDSVAVRPRDPSIRIALGLAYAGLGRKDDAMREARTAMELAPLAASNPTGTAFMGGAIEVYLKAGEHDEALRLIELLLAMRAGREISVPLLRMEPMFDPLRGDPRFEQLLVRFSRS
jgi:eukaryotic-like serine/threonine-protein kinase